MAESVLKDVRVRYTKGLWEAQENKNDDGSVSRKYGIPVLIPKKDKATIDRLKKEIKAVIDANGAWTAKQKQTVYLTATSAELGGVYNKFCILKDGDAYNERRADEAKAPDSAYTDHYYVNFSRNGNFGAPFVVARDGKTELSAVQAQSELLPGYRINIQYSFYAWTNKAKGSAGCSAQFSGVQVNRKDEVFGREKMFDAVEEELSEDPEAFSE